MGSDAKGEWQIQLVVERGKLVRGGSGREGVSADKTRSQKIEAGEKER